MHIDGLRFQYLARVLIALATAIFASSTYIRTMYSSGSVIVAAEVLSPVGTSVIANLNPVSLIGFQMITVGKS
jgi:hypothetical protein